MDKSKLAKYEFEMANNFSGVKAVTDSLYSALCEPIIKPFTKDDLHRLYDYYKAMFKHQIENDDSHTDDDKESRKKGIDALLFIGEQYDLNKMTSDPYYPPRQNQINIFDRIVFSILANSIITGLKKILYDNQPS